MQPYPIELRERIVEFVNGGGSKAEASRRFKVCRMSVHRYVGAGNLSPRPQGGSPKRFACEKLRQAVREKPSATLEEYAKVLGVSHSAVWKRLRQMAITLKKNS